MMARRALLRACVCVLDSKFSISSVIPGPTNLEFMLNCTLGRPLAAVSERSASWSITWGKHLDEEPIREAFRGTGPDFLILRPLSLVQGARSAFERYKPTFVACIGATLCAFYMQVQVHKLQLDPRLYV